MKIFSRLFLLLLFIPAFLISCSDDNSVADEVIIDFEELPIIAKEFIIQHFSDQDVIKVEKKLILDPDMKRYKVDLTNDIEVAFDYLGYWLKVETNNYLPVPSEIVPKLITDYVLEFYPTSIIKEIEKKDFGYSIELNTDLDLNFDSGGNLINIAR